MLARLALVLASPLHVAALSSEYYVLRHLYEVTDGANWKNNENWLDGEPCQNNWMSSSHYDCFSGELKTEPQPVCCQASAKSLATVVKLDLYDNHLSGTIPPELRNLDSLRLLVLDSNSLHGNIPTALGDLYYLRVLWLQNNAISGTIPTELKEHLGNYKEDLGYSFDPGGVILTPNRFNCSIINGVGMDWANNTLDHLFRDNIAPKGYNQRGQDKGCIEDEGDLIINNVTIVQQQELFLEADVTDNPIIRVIAVVRRATCRHPHTPPLAPIASCSPSPSPPPTRHHPPTQHQHQHQHHHHRRHHHHHHHRPLPLGPPLQFSIAAGAVIVIETIRRLMQRRRRAKGAKSEEEQEADRAAQQAQTLAASVVHHTSHTHTHTHTLSRRGGSN